MSDLPDYTTPPLNEVALGCRFVPVPGLTLPLIGAFWASRQDEYPLTEHAAPVADESGNLQVDPVTGVPWPRLWMSSLDKTRLLQLQMDRVLVNWRRISDGNVYPRYPDLLSSFKRVFVAFKEFVAANCNGAELLVTGCELIYINHISLPGELSPPQIAEKIFGSRAWLPSVSAGQVGPFGWINSYHLTDGSGRLAIKIGPAVRLGDKKAVTVLELSVLGLPPPGQDSDAEKVEAWMDRAHHAIVSTFAEITDLDVQRQHWGRL